jgi:hypothetical protein
MYVFISANICGTILNPKQPDSQVQEFSSVKQSRAEQKVDLAQHIQSNSESNMRLRTENSKVRQTAKCSSKVV